MARSRSTSSIKPLPGEARRTFVPDLRAPSSSPITAGRQNGAAVPCCSANSRGPDTGNEPNRGFSIPVIDGDLDLDSLLDERRRRDHLLDPDNPISNDLRATFRCRSRSRTAPEFRGNGSCTSVDRAAATDGGCAGVTERYFAGNRHSGLPRSSEFPAELGELLSNRTARGGLCRRGPARLLAATAAVIDGDWRATVTNPGHIRSRKQMTSPRR